MAELRRVSWWGGVALAVLLGWAGLNLEILQFDDRPERAWGICLSTAETLGLLLTLAARLRGADLSGAEGWPEALGATRLGAGGLSTAETAAAAAVGWVGAAGSAMLLLVFATHVGPAPLGIAVWGVYLFVELALVTAWLTLAGTWLGRLPAVALAVAALCLGRAGVGGPAAGLWPAAAPVPPESLSPAALAASLAAVVGLTALAIAGRPPTRTFD